MAKKIFLVLPALCGGGAEKIWIYLANIFANKGFDVTLVILSQNAQDYLSLIDKQVKLLYFKKHNYILQAWLLSRLIHKQKPDVVLSSITQANLVSIMAAQLSGVKTKVFVGNTNTFSQYKKIKKKLRVILARILYPLAFGIISPSIGVHEDCLRAGIKNKNMTVIYNFVDRKEIEKLSQEKIPSFRKNQGPCILSVGRFVQLKRFDYIIRAFHALTEQYPAYQHATLCILGKGNAKQQQRLQHLVQSLALQDQVVFPGFHENPYPFYAQANLFVLASTTEGLSNVLIEALVLKCNIVATDCPYGPNEVLDNGTYGRLIPVTDDIPVLAKAMHDALENPMDKNKLTHAVDRFDVDHIVQQYIDFMGISEQ